MKQVTKTPELMSKMRAAYGAGANLDDIAVFQASLLNTLPVRKTGGLYKGAVHTVEHLAQMSAAANTESVAINSQHGLTSAQDVVGRLFGTSVDGAELLGYLGMDAKNHPELVSKMDNGTIDQVSVGFLPSAVQCSACGWDFMGPDATLDNLWSATCANDHVMGTDEAHANVNGVASFYELALVPMGGARGARIRDASHSSNEPLRLAASAKGGGNAAYAVELTATPKETSTVDYTAFTATLTAQAGELATLKLTNAASVEALTVATAANVTLTAKVVELEAKVTAAATGDVAVLTEKATKAEAAAKVALDHLTGEATKIFTACGTPLTEIPTEMGALVEAIAAKRAAFAAAIPGEARSVAPGADDKTASTPRFSTAYRA